MIILSLFYANLCKYHRLTDIQTNTSKVKFGTSQNRKRRVQWNKLPWTTQTHRTQPPDSPWPVGTRRSP